jgi:hypothetical protein
MKIGQRIRWNIACDGRYREAPVDWQTLMIGAAGVVFVVIALGAAAYAGRHRPMKLSERFGPEYDGTVQAVGGPIQGDSNLLRRSARMP